MQIGQMDRLVTLQQRTLIQDAAGQAVESWSTVDNIWARKLPQKGSERFTAQQVLGRAVVTYRIRYRAGLAVNTHRLLDDGRAYDLHDIREVGRRAALDLDATARSEG